jgi:uncharacterized protein (DUF1015 family)
MARIEAFKAIFPNMEKDPGLTRVSQLRYEESCLQNSSDRQPCEVDFSVSTVLYEQLLGQGILEDVPLDGIYVYETFDHKNLYSGVWALTSVDDLFSGKIKKHELMFTNDELFLKKYRQQTGIEGVPVLLTYAPDAKINDLIRFVIQNQKPRRFEAGNKRHCLWKVVDPELIARFKNEFSHLTSVYIADGHRRCAAVVASTREMHRSWQVDENRPDAWFSSLYISADQLASYEFNRLAKPAEAENILPPKSTWVEPKIPFGLLMRRIDHCIPGENAA